VLLPISLLREFFLSNFAVSTLIKPNVKLKKTTRKNMKEKELRDMLGRGLVSLQFVKKNGETRNAVGTLNRWFIPRDKWPKSQETSSTTNEAALALRRSGWVKDDYVRFYDFTVQNWRCLVCTEVLEAKPISLSLNLSIPSEGEGMEDDEPSHYNGMDYNDYKFEEALRKLENDLTAQENA
jgi:hypothetical protein